MEGVWKVRWAQLKEAGLTWEQAKVVYCLLDEARAFGYQWVAEKAYWALEETYGEVTVVQVATRLNQLVVGKSTSFTADNSYHVGEIRNRVYEAARSIGIGIHLLTLKGKRGGTDFILQVTRVA